MPKAKPNLSTPCPVGVVIRRDAPLIEKLTAADEPASYAVALDESRSYRRWIPASTPFLIALLSVVDFFKFPR